MKKIASPSFIALIIVLLLIAYVIFWKQAVPQRNQAVDSSDFFDVYKKGCDLYRYRDTGGVYKDEMTGLRFVYPAHTLVCERTEGNAGAKEVSIWIESEYDSGGALLPVATVNIDNPLINTLPQPIVLSTTEKNIGNEVAIVKSVKSSQCTSEQCLTYTTASLSPNDHTIIIELRTEDMVLDDFSFGAK